METKPTVSQQEEIVTEKAAPTLQPWSTPRLQYLNSHDAAKPWTPFSETSSSGPNGGPS